MRRDNNRKTLDECLRGWDVQVPQDPHLKQRVLNRIAALAEEENERAPLGLSFIGRLGGRGFFALASACTALVLISAAFFVREHSLARERSYAQAHSYFLLINPLAHSEFPEGAYQNLAPEDPSMIDMLAWMRSSLDLSRDQFAALVELHEGYEDRFVSLYNDLCDINAQYQGFEKKRMNDDMIDFMELYDLLRERETLRECSAKTSQQFVSLVLKVLTPEQAQDYLAFLGRSGVPLNIPNISPDNAGA
ncbi:MAG: anti-sigma factor [Opitutales bacterium]|nr:anti-sigma factor [Opitutales bacterium]